MACARRVVGQRFDRTVSDVPVLAADSAVQVGANFHRIRPGRAQRWRFR